MTDQTHPVDQPHVIVVYTESEPDDNGRWARTVVGPFPNRDHAIVKSGELATYGLECDVLILTPKP